MTQEPTLKEKVRVKLEARFGEFSDDDIIGEKSMRKPTPKQLERARKDIDWIKQEVADGRHISAATASRGYIYTSDFENLAVISDILGETEFAAKLRTH